MISELVMFDLPRTMTREQVVEAMREVAPTWRANPDLIRKTFLYDAAGARTGALYLWKNRRAADAAHGEAFRRRVHEKFGSEPSFEYFETPLVVDNALGATIEETR